MWLRLSLKIWTHISASLEAMRGGIEPTGCDLCQIAVGGTGYQGCGNQVGQVAHGGDRAVVFCGTHRNGSGSQGVPESLKPSQRPCGLCCGSV